MKSIHITDKFNSKEITPPFSKSYINRAIILAAQKEGPSVINNITYAGDIVDMLNCLEKIGLKIERKPNQLVVLNNFSECAPDDSVELNTGEGGTTTRFLTALCSLGSHLYTISPSGNMKNRDIHPLVNALKECGVTFESEEFPLKLKGPVNGNRVKVDCSKSTQFYSALKLIGVDVEAINISTSGDYIKMTDKLFDLNEFISPIDFSGAANFIALGLVFDGVVITNVAKRDYFQGDSQILDWIEEQGGSYKFLKGNLEISRLVEVKPFEWDCKNCLDFVPVLAYLAAKAKGPSLLKNISNLEGKESNRIEEIISMLEKFGVFSSYECGDLEIRGITSLKSVEFLCPPHDHRMIMLGALLLKSSGGGRLDGIDGVEKSYPGFFEVL